MSEEQLWQYLETVEGKDKLLEIVNNNNIEEIERLSNELKLYKDNHEHLNNLLQQKENIIKEVREYINNKNIEPFTKEDLLEILDKGE